MNYNQKIQNEVVEALKVLDETEKAKRILVEKVKEDIREKLIYVIAHCLANRVNEFYLGEEQAPLNVRFLYTENKSWTFYENSYVEEILEEDLNLEWSYKINKYFWFFRRLDKTIKIYKLPAYLYDNLFIGDM